ncbi:MAG TPA: response regulator transcription factor [Acidimicrobiales bacterium]|nr:response regulator transcription factor [Acidimicrobiales bacterium]
MISRVGSPVTRVLVADTQPLFAEAVGAALDQEDDIEVIPRFPTRGGDALETIQLHRPDVVIYDHWMLEVDGPTATRALASSVPETKVLILSWYHGTVQIQAALSAGATGFLPKSLRLEQLVEAVRRAAAGDPLVFGDELAKLIEGIEERYEGGSEFWERFASLSPREMEVLRAIADAAPPAQVAEKLGISVGTLKNHIHHILAKTATSSQLEVVSLARVLGLVVESRPGPAAPSGTPAASLVRSRRRGPAKPSPDRAGRCSVLVADTERLFAEALGRCLAKEADFSVMPVFPTYGLAAVECVLRHRPDVVLYDLWLRGLQGTAAVRALGRWCPGTKPILLSWFHGRPQVRRALASASVGLVPKTAGLATVVEAVLATHGRPTETHAAELVELVDILRVGDTPADDRLERLLTLSLREMELLQQMSFGIPAKRIAQEMSLAVGTVKNSIHQLLAKTGARNQAEAVAIARDHGFLD